MSGQRLKKIGNLRSNVVDVKKGSVVICLYVLFASVAIAIIALGSWFKELFTKKEYGKEKNVSEFADYGTKDRESEGIRQAIKR